VKRKIAAILAADAVGYSRLVAEDEEDTLARLASYRALFSDFINRFGGRIFNTAGDAILAEFESAVDAVRCAVDIQESLRARNLAYTPSRQMSFRIGIVIGDIVERDGDLLGDDVNVAARLESVAPEGGICISRSVYDAVANKLSVQFSDRGQQHLKNIPNPVHAYTFAPDVSSKNRKQASHLASLVTRHWLVLAVVMVVIAGIGGFMFGGREETGQSVKPMRPPAPATEASVPSVVESDVETANRSNLPAIERHSAVAEQKDEKVAVGVYPEKPPIVGEDLPKTPGLERIVKMFDVFCLSLVPELSRIAETAATRNFTELKGKWLEKYQPQVRAEELRAWTYKDFGSEYTLTTTRSKPDAQFQKQFPKFANSKNFACSLIIPFWEVGDYFYDEVVRLVGREPDATGRDQGEHYIHAWREMTDNRLVIIEYQRPRPGRVAILRAMAFVKN